MSKAIIVGASSGIGLEVARLFIQRGWTVGVAARRLDLLQTIGAADVEQIDVVKAMNDICDTFEYNAREKGISILRIGMEDSLQAWNIPFSPRSFSVLPAKRPASC